jgi:MFS family permease
MEGERWRGLRGRIPDLPRSVWVLEASGFVDSFGTGLVFPFVVVYLHDVRHFSAAMAGFFIAARGATGLALAPVGGVATDRFGPRLVAIVAMVVAAAGWLALAGVHHPWQAFAVAIVIGTSSAGFWPAYNALFAELASRELRHVAYSVSNLMRNGGIGLGAAVGGLVANSAHPGTYTALFALNAATFLIYAVVALSLPSVHAKVTERDQLAGRGYRVVLADRALLAIAGLNATFIATFTAANYFVGPYLKEHAGVSERGIGAIWVVNTAAIVVLQLPIARAAIHHRYMRSLAVAAALWALCLAFIGVTGATLVGVSAIVVVSTAFVLYAATDCLLTPIQGAVVAELAPDSLRGRYMAVSSMSWEVGMVLGPATAGLIYTISATGLWFVFAGVAIATGLAALRLERVLPTNARQPPTSSEPTRLAGQSHPASNWEA